ncbi:MAG: DUF6055 domain-containing protein [Armatimonadetes bacterium]|nr:DUF6055 domain-containing protein [Armatimonadota bacterium]
MTMRKHLYRSWLLLPLIGLSSIFVSSASMSTIYLDNQTDHSNQALDTETRRSDHFRIAFGHYNRDFGTPVTEQLIQGNLQMFEHLWQRNIVENGLNDMGQSAILALRDGNYYKVNFVMLMTWNDGGGGGAYMSMDSMGFSWAMANAGYCRYDPPSGATPHEIGHAWEGQARGFNGSNSSGAWWECTANWFQLQLLNEYPTDGIIYNGMYYPCHGRDYYGCFTIWEAFVEDPRYGMAYVNSVWTDATADQQVNEYIIERMARVDTSGSPDKIGANRDMWGNIAKKRVTWDFARGQWFAQENMAESDSNYWGWYQRCRTPLVKMPGVSGIYRPTRSHIPMEYGFDIIPLTANAGTTVSCNFQGQCDPVRQSDWRACLVAVNNSGEPKYSSLWNMGTNSITLSADESKLYLVVTATPKPMSVNVWNAYILDSGAQFPYTMSFTNATPKNVIYPAYAGAHSHHANGGGIVQSGAVVASTAYVGPNAQVLDTAHVNGYARIEDYAVVRNNAVVEGNAVISGHAMVQDSAHVYGNGKVRDWARVFGDAQVYDEAKVIEHANFGDSGNVAHGCAVVKGTSYVYSPSDFLGSIIVDGDTANGNGTTLADHGVHFGWQWGQNQSIFTSLVENNYIYAQHTFEIENAVWAKDEYGINHGFLMNGCRAAKDTAAPTRGGRVLPLDGVSQYVELHNSVNDFKETAISVWVKWTGSANDQRIWSMGDGASKYMYLTPKDTSTGKLRFVISNGTTTESLDGAAAVTANTWTHIAIVFSGATTTSALYVNGVSVASNAAATLYPDSVNAPLMENANYLGRGNAGNYFQGYLDDFRVYMHALTPAEITTLYGTAAPGTVNITADTTAPTPNAATWLVAPTPVALTFDPVTKLPVIQSDNSITMSATPGTDASGWVEYYFQCTSGGGHDSGWVSFNKYTDVGLTPGVAYTYVVRMRDKNANTTADSAPASATTLVCTAPAQPTFAYGPVGISSTAVTMTANKVTSPSGRVEYNFIKFIPIVGTIGSSGWQSSSTWTDTAVSSGTFSYKFQVRDGRGNLSPYSASVAINGANGDKAAPKLSIPVAQWGMMPYATIDNKISMTARAATDLNGVQYLFECTSGGGPNSAWQDGTTFVTSALADGTYSYRYKTRDKSTSFNESGYSTTYSATIKPTTGFHNYTFSEVPTLPDDYLVKFTGIVTQVNTDNYIVKDPAGSATIKVYPNTYGMTTNSSLLFTNVSVEGHMWTYTPGVKVVSYATVASEGGGSTLLITGKVTNSSGVGISGAKVYFALSPNAFANPITTATTNSLGNYSRTIMDGTWYIAASADDYNPSADQIVTVSGASVPNVNFSLDLSPKVSGRVSDVSGVGINGGTVYFSKVAGAVTNYTYKATTDSRGNYIKGIPDGAWYVAANAPGYANSTERTITVAGNPISGIDFTLTLGGDGLKGEYFDNDNFTSLMITRVDTSINFDWSGVAPDPSMGTDTFSVRWTGWVKPKYTQTYTFYTTSDDGVRLWVNNTQLVDNWTVHGSTENSGTIDLVANAWYPIKMEYYQGGGGAVAKLEWQSASQGRQLIPAAQLCSATNAGYMVYGQVTDDIGNAITGATVYFSTTANASVSPTYTATTDFQGKYNKIIPNGAWYVASGKSGYTTTIDQTVTMNNANIGNINFSLIPTVTPLNVFYNFDETSGTTVLDSSGNAKDGTLVNNPTRIVGKIGNAISFDGTNDFISVPALTEYNAISIAGWINLASLGTDTTGSSIISSEVSSSGSLQLTILKATGKLRFSIIGNSPAAVDSDTGLGSSDFGKWRHVAVVYESASGAVKFYINGNLISTQTFTTSRTPLLTNLLRIGSYGAIRCFDGKMDDFRIYRKALNSAEINNLIIDGSYVTIGAAKKLDDGDFVAFNPKSVTYAPRNTSGARTTTYFYVEETNHSAGILVTDGLTGQDAVNENVTATFTGIMHTNLATGERYVELNSPATVGGASVVSPLGMNTKSVANDKVVLGSLARVAGKVTYVSPDGLYLNMSDGSNADITVIVETGTPISRIHVGDIIVVNGVVSKMAGTPSPLSMLLVRSITRQIPPDNGASLFYKFDETSGTSAFDWSYGDRNGTLVGAGATWSAGKYGNSLTLSGTTSYMTIPSGVVSSLTNFTIATWVNVDVVTSLTRIFDFGTSTTNYMYLSPKHASSSGRLRFEIRVNSGTAQNISYSAALPTGWHHVAVTLNGNTGTLYYDGVSVATNTSMTLRPSGLGNTTANYLGKSQTTSTATLDGRIDDFRIYNSALIAADVLKLYNGLLN